MPRRILFSDIEGLVHVAVATRWNTADALCEKKDLIVREYWTLGHPNAPLDAVACKECLMRETGLDVDGR